MSDLHRAIQDRADAYRPDRTPPFSVLQARKRRRDQRRAGTAVALSVVAVLSVVVGPTAVGLTGGEDRAGQIAQGDRQGGLNVELSVEPTQTAGEVSVVLRITDDDSGGLGYQIDYGDGKTDEVAAPVGSCPPPSTPASPILHPLDETITLRHTYARPGEYEVQAVVTSQRTCDAAVVENATETAPVTVGEPPVTNDTDAYRAAFYACMNTKGYNFTKDPRGGWGGQISGPGVPSAEAKAKYDVDTLACQQSLGVNLRPPRSDGETQSYTLSMTSTAGDNPRLKEERLACLSLPGVNSVVGQPGEPVRYRVTVTGNQANQNFQDCVRTIVGITVPELD